MALLRLIYRWLVRHLTVRMDDAQMAAAYAEFCRLIP